MYSNDEAFSRRAIICSRRRGSPVPLGRRL